MLYKPTMRNQYFLIIFLSLLFISCAKGQDTYNRNNDADVKHYIFNLSLNDETNEITGEAEIKVEFKNATNNFNLDLIGKNGVYGMELIEVLENNEKAKYTYEDDIIVISPSLDATLKSTYKVRYRGIPERGLVIDTTKYGQRSFFGDNWPNLARYWLPTVDHPYDKASIEFD